MLNQAKAMKERFLENHLRFYRTYQIGIKNCEQQLEFIMPNCVTNYGTDESGNSFFVIGSDTTSNVAIDRIEGKRALDLKEEIERYKLITSSIDNAMTDLKEQEMNFVKYRYFDRLPISEVKQKLGYSEEKTVYRIRRHVLDKLLISLNNLSSLK